MRTHALILGIAAVLLFGCADPLAPDAELTPQDGWLYEAECHFWVPAGKSKEFLAQLPWFYAQRCSKIEVTEIIFGG